MQEEIIAKEGDTSKRFFILVEGTVGIFKGEKKIAEFSESGTILGELSLILNKPRTATIKALTFVNLLIVEGELDEIIKRYPDYSKKLIKSLAERLAKTDELFLSK
jgi:CRP-like cAMP-binding protein